jgi:hypothetical protein
MTAPKTVADGSYSIGPCERGKDSRIAVTSYVPDVLKVAGHVAPATIVLPSPINTALIDYGETVRYSTELQIAKDAVEAQNAANTATTSSDVSLAVARVVAKTHTSGRPDAHRARRERGVQGLCAYRKVLTVGDASNAISHQTQRYRSSHRCHRRNS